MGSIFEIIQKVLIEISVKLNDGPIGGLKQRTSEELSYPGWRISLTTDPGADWFEPDSYRSTFRRQGGGNSH